MSRRRWEAHVSARNLTAAAAVGGVSAVALSRVTGVALPPCPTHALAGIECPGCGAGRSVSALLDGEVAAALSYNPLVPVTLLLLAGAFAFPAGSVGRLLRARHASLTVGVLVAAFWAVRLVPWAGFDALRANT